MNRKLRVAGLVFGAAAGIAFLTLEQHHMPAPVFAAAASIVVGSCSIGSALLARGA